MQTKDHFTPFNQLSKEGQRVVIAQDIIAQVKAKKAIPKSQVFLEFDELPPNVIGSSSTLREIQSKTENCFVCALGAIMLAQLNVNGDVKLSELKFAQGYKDESLFVDARLNAYSNEFSPYILQYFSKEQLQMIEIAFEQGDGAFAINHYFDGVDDGDNNYSWSDVKDDSGIVISENDARDSYDFGKYYKNINDRLIAIMNNIINNGGEFMP